MADLITCILATLGAAAGGYLGARARRPPVAPARRRPAPPTHDAVVLSDAELAAMEEDGPPDDQEPAEGRTYAG